MLVKLKTQIFRAFRGSFADITGLTEVGDAVNEDKKIS